MECRYWAVVPAAGTGSRMHAAEPKQYLRIAGKTLIEHTLERLLTLDFLTGIVVVVSADDSRWRSLRIAHHPQIYAVEGGAERSGSVLNALHFLRDHLRPQDWVMVHDAARPCVRLSDIQRLRELTYRHPVGGLLGVPVCDTLKRVDGRQTVQATVDRRELWQAQTPQSFRFGLLLDSLSGALAAGDSITDEASAIEQGGHQPLLVQGHRDNIKITHPEDLAMADLIVRMQQRVPQADADSAVPAPVFFPD